MKNRFLYLLSVLLLLAGAGCSRVDIQSDRVPSEGEGDEVTLTFRAITPGYDTKTLRTEGTEDFRVIVFNENDKLVQIAKATYDVTSTGLAGEFVEEGTFTVKLNKSIRVRTIHVVRGYDWSDFNPMEHIGDPQRIFFRTMHTDKETFWGMVELPNGIVDNSLDGKTVLLLRNRAQIQVTSTASNFQVLGFALHNGRNSGMVAPYNPTTNKFEKGAITVPVSSTVIPLVEPVTWNTDSKYTFEHDNKVVSADKVAYVIVKGRYNGTDSYYKIDIVDSNKNRYDIERNYIYKININEVLRAGASTVTGAIVGNAHNNVYLDASIEVYPMISDGVRQLSVERSLVIITKPSEAVTLWAKYIPNIANMSVTDNSKIRISIDQQADRKVIETHNYNNGSISFTAVNALPSEPYAAKINVQVEGQELARTIRVVMRNAFNFAPVTINSLSSGIVLNGQSANATLSFNISGDFPDDLMPLMVKINANGLYPASSGLQMQVEGGKMYYYYRATSKGTQTINFKTNQTAFNETVKIEADYFTPAQIAYRVQ